VLEAHADEVGREADEARHKAAAEADEARTAQMQQREAELSAMLQQAQTRSVCAFTSFFQI